MNINIEGQKIEQEYTRVTNILSSPEIIKEPIRFKEYRRLSKELEPKIRVFKEYQKTAHEIEKLAKLLEKEKDSEMVGLVGKKKSFRERVG
jgi:protein subunit release factor A